MKNHGARIAELATLAQQKNLYSSLAQRLSDAQRPYERDISSYAGTLKKSDTDRAIDRDVLHYSYGL